jgi:hypothetical protein
MTQFVENRLNPITESVREDEMSRGSGGYLMEPHSEAPTEQIHVPSFSFLF